MNIFNMGQGVSFDIDTVVGLAAAVAWLNAMFDKTADGGSWVVPRSMSSYEVNHTTHTVTRKMGMFEEPIIERVIVAAGWKYANKSAAN